MAFSKRTILSLVFAVAFAIAVAGCGNTTADSSASVPAGSASTQQVDEQAQPYVGMWKADGLTLMLKTNAADKEMDFDVPVAVELGSDMTGTVTIGDSSQGIEWEVRTWENLKLERAVITLHESFKLEGIVCDTENLLLEFTDAENSAHLFNHWTSRAQSGVKLGVDTMVEKAS
ncbi:MAG: hypothetical protein Q4C36_05585 [Coriobacteriia bacterium]|nr:hypothetical protein [Coriobacteriia bacterium]